MDKSRSSEKRARLVLLAFYTLHAICSTHLRQMSFWASWQVVALMSSCYDALQSFPFVSLFVSRMAHMKDALHTVYILLGRLDLLGLWCAVTSVLSKSCVVGWIWGRAHQRALCLSLDCGSDSPPQTVTALVFQGITTLMEANRCKWVLLLFVSCIAGWMP